MVAAGLCGSNREARQLVQQGGVLVDGEKVTDPKAVLTVDALSKGVVIKKGKKVYHKGHAVKQSCFTVNFITHYKQTSPLSARQMLLDRGLLV